MTFSRDDLTSKQKDYAVFLPALSGFYATYVGKQRADPNYVDPARIPADFETGIEGLNWLNKEEAYFPYKWALYSAGHAELDINKVSPKEDMIRNRDRKNSFVVGDSGGFQIGKGVWEGDWKDINCPKASLKRAQVLSWMDAYMDRGMILDIPAWVAKSPRGREATGIFEYKDAVSATRINNDFFMKNRNGNCKFLNVLQGETHTEADNWYQQMKDYCDPKKHAQPFEGWAMGGQNMCDITLILKRLVEMRHDGLLEKGYHDWMHFLGTSKLEWACLLTDVQRAVRKHHNENFTVSFDCASPFLATANGQIYITTELPDNKKWTYRMTPSIDDKKYATDIRRFKVAIEGHHKRFKGFEDSPVSERTLIKDVCIYAPGDLNKINKEGLTSWDSFSYAIQMGHNVHRHIYAVQEANRQYDAGLAPRMLRGATAGDLATTRQIIDEIFATSDKGTALALIKYHEAFLESIIGTRGLSGKKSRHGKTMSEQLWDGDIALCLPKTKPVAKVKTKVIFGEAFGGDDEITEHHQDDSGLDEAKLASLEESV